MAKDDHQDFVTQKAKQIRNQLLGDTIKEHNTTISSMKINSKESTLIRKSKALSERTLHSLNPEVSHYRRSSTSDPVLDTRSKKADLFIKGLDKDKVTKAFDYLQGIAMKIKADVPNNKYRRLNRKVTKTGGISAMLNRNRPTARQSAILKTTNFEGLADVIVSGNNKKKKTMTMKRNIMIEVESLIETTNVISIPTPVESVQKNIREGFQILVQKCDPSSRSSNSIVFDDYDNYSHGGSSFKIKLHHCRRKMSQLSDIDAA
jgi:hypothetical protein